MKRFTLLAMSLMMALVVTAQNAGNDVTSQYFVNTDFETGTTDGWSYDDQGLAPSHNSTAAANGFQGTHFMEVWCRSYNEDTKEWGFLGDFDWYQEAELPNGYYGVKAMAHAIQQHDADFVPSGVYIYAGDQEIEVTSTTAAEYSVFVAVTNGKLRIGFRGRSPKANWVVCDDFRVIEYDGANENEAKVSWVKYEAQVVVEEIEPLLKKYLSKQLKDAVSANIASLKTASDGNTAEALWKKLEQQKGEVEECIEVYNRLNDKIGEALEYVEDGADELEEIAYAALEKYESGAYDAKGAEAEIEALGKAIYEYQQSVADGYTGFDVTEQFVKNPSVRTKALTEGWTITSSRSDMPAFGHECIEFFESNFTISQKLTGLPNGKYSVRVQGFYRDTWNDGPSRHEGGTEVLTAEVFANNNASLFTSLYVHTADEIGVDVNVKNGYVDGLQSAGLAFNTKNESTSRNYYDDNEVTAIVTNGELTIGVRNTSSLAGRWCIFRDFKLFYYGNFPYINYQGLTSRVREGFNTAIIPNAVKDELEKYMEEHESYEEEEAYSDEEVNAVIAELEAMWAEALLAADLLAELKTESNEINDLLSLGYPGKDALQAVLVELDAYLSETSTINTYANMKAMKAKVDEAVSDYLYSQEYSRENPLDLTSSFVPELSTTAPWTMKNEVGGWVDVNMRDAQPWIVDGVTINEGMNCLNAWAGEITSLDVFCDIVNLRDGVYSLSVDATTEEGTLNDQHAYMTTTFGTVESDPMSFGGFTGNLWETLTIEMVPVVGGKLRIGFASTGKGGSSGWFQINNFKLYYHGEATAEDMQDTWSRLEARTNEALEIMLPSERTELATAKDYAISLMEAGKFAEACVHLSSVLEKWDEAITATENFYAGYYEKLDTIRKNPGYKECEQTFGFADATLALADNFLAADTTTHSVFAALDDKLHAYANYASSLRDAEKLLKDETYQEEYKKYMTDSIITPQTDSLLYSLRGSDYCYKLRAVLDKAVALLKATSNINKEIEKGDVTFLINNPEVSFDEEGNLSGWLNGKDEVARTNKGEHYSGDKENTYLDAWGSQIAETFYQELTSIPDGTYRLKVAARTDGKYAYIFAATNADVKDASTLFVDVENNNAYRGQIWYDDSLAWVEDGCPEEDLEVNYPYFMARPSEVTIYGEGYGWSWHVIENIEVTNHYLAIGITSNKEFSGKDKKFTGSWFGADDWKLELVKINEVQSEYNPFGNLDIEIKPEDNAVEEIEVAAPVMQGIYDLFGRRVDTPAVSGIYIVNGKKVVIK